MNFPSDSEGLPNNIVESCLYGLPIITRDVGSISDWIENGQNGFVSKSKNPDDYIVYIKKLVSDKDLFQKVALNNHTLAMENFIPDKVKSRILHIYNKVGNAS